MIKSLLLFIAALFAMSSLYSQSQQAVVSPPITLPAGYLDKVNDQVAHMDGQLSGQTQKYLQSIASNETSLKSKLQKVDSNSAKTIFGDVKKRYQKLQTSVLSGSATTSISGGGHIPSLDSLKNTLLFLQQNKNFMASLPPSQVTKLTNALASIQALQSKVNAANNLKDVLNQRTQYLSQQLAKYNLTKNLGGLDQKVYYYKQQFNDWKESVKDPTKVGQKASLILSQVPAYNQFMQQHSFLSSIFGTPESYNLSDSSMQGLQTRATVQKMIQDKVATGGPGADQKITQQVQQGGDAMGQLKSQLLQLGSKQDPDDPTSFKPNTQKTKSLWKRLVYGASLQFEPAQNILPTLCDLGLTLGYKLNDNGEIGVGLAYKMGLGDGIQDIHFSSQGLGLQSYIDWKLKKQLYLTGGYEQNYLSRFNSLSQLRQISSWQQSGLIGLSRKYKISPRLNGKIQLLFDFLSYSQIPRTQPILFRVGWSL